MNNLAALQRAFQRHVCGAAGQVMERAVLATPRASAARRLGVYTYAYPARLVGALTVEYPVLKSVLGEAKFDRVMREFITVAPSRHANLRWYGGQLSGYLVRSPRWSRRPLLAELAQFEWALSLAFDAADAEPIPADEVAQVPAADWPGLCFRLHPAVRQLRLRSNAPKIWQMVSAGQQAPRAAVRSQPVHWLVWRKDRESYFRVLPPQEAWALGAVARGRNFAVLCGGMRRYVGTSNAAQTGVQLLRNWLSEGLICGIAPPR